MGSFELVEMLDRWFNHPKPTRTVSSTYLRALKRLHSVVTAVNFLILYMATQLIPGAGAMFNTFTVVLFVVTVFSTCFFLKRGFTQREMNIAVVCCVARVVYFPIYATANTQLNPDLLKTSGNSTLEEALATFDELLDSNYFYNFLMIIVLLVRCTVFSAIRCKNQADRFEEAEKYAAEMSEFEMESHVYM